MYRKRILLRLPVILGVLGLAALAGCDLNGDSTETFSEEEVIEMMAADLASEGGETATLNDISSSPPKTGEFTYDATWNGTYVVWGAALRPDDCRRSHRRSHHRSRVSPEDFLDCLPQLWPSTVKAKPGKKKAIGGVMLTAALTSIITGITEPIEFAFMFVAPILYVVHVVLAFAGGLLMNLAGVRLTETFTSSLIDYAVSISTGNAGNPIMLLPVGLVIGAAYFLAFYYLIGKLNLATPGRETQDEEQIQIPTTQKAREVLMALGGSKNILALDACITRLRLEVQDKKLVNKERLKALGSPGIMEAGATGVQVIFGTEAERLKDEIKVLRRIPTPWMPRSWKPKGKKLP